MRIMLEPISLPLEMLLEGELEKTSQIERSFGLPAVKSIRGQLSEGSQGWKYGVEAKHYVFRESNSQHSSSPGNKSKSVGWMVGSLG